MFAPVVLDLNSDGISITEKTSSNTYFDMAGDGMQHLTAWAGAGDGVLVYDVDNNSVIDRQNEVVFTEWDPTAETDMQALRSVFDSDHDGKLDAGDANFSRFKVLVTKTDGTKELKTLAELGITSIDLISNNQTIVQVDGSKITGATTFTRADGSTGLAGDAGFAFDGEGHLVQSTVTSNTDGSTQIATRSFNTDGTIESERKLITSADGMSRTLQIDLEGDGVADRIQTDVTVLNGDGSTTRTLTNLDGGGVLQDRTITLTSSDRKTVRISRDLSGGGIVEQEEVRVSGADSSLTVTVRNANADGTTKDRTVTVTSGDGLSKTEHSELTGSGAINVSVVTATIANPDGSRVETVSTYSGAGIGASNKSRSVESQTSADGRSKAVSTDENGDGTIDSIWSREISAAADGSSVTTETEANNDGSRRSRTVTEINADGLSRTVREDADGDGDLDMITTDVTLVGADGGKTQTVTTANGDLSTRSRSTKSWSADGRTRTISIDTDGDGAVDSSETISVDSGITTDTVLSYSPNGSTLTGRKVSTISADGLSRSDETDLNADGITDLRSHTNVVRNADGSSTTTTTQFNGAGSVQISKSVVDVSANGLTTVVRRYNGADNIADTTSTDTTFLNADGSIVRALIQLAGTKQVSRTVTVTSADRNSETTSSFINGNTTAAQISSTTTKADGSKVLNVSTYSPNGAILLARTTTMISADGLTTTVTVDLNGDSNIDSRNIETLVLNADGTTSKTMTAYRGSEVAAANRVAETVTTTSANAQSVTRLVDLEGDGRFDRLITDQASINLDGSNTRVVSQLNGAGTTLIDRTVTTITANKMLSVQQSDLDGDGAVDRTTTDQTVIQSDGSTIRTVSTVDATGHLMGQVVTTALPDGRSGSIATDLNGDGGFDIVEAVSIAANGDVVNTVSRFAPDGAHLINKTVKTAAANGLESRIQEDSDGDGDFDRLTRSTTVINPDGSKTVTATIFNGDGMVRAGKTISTTSADGLTTNVKDFIDGDEIADLTTVTTRSLNADGSISQVVDEFGGANYNKLTHRSTVISADGRNSGETFSDGIPVAPVQTTSHVVNPDGTDLTIQKTSWLATANAASETKTTTLSADGLTKAVRNDYFDYDGAFFYAETISSATVLRGMVPSL
ncbi:hypothetical protein LZK73_30220 (plasmid) [Neorhizobium galegae]|nr:hypothetical protein LZK73_30220 [Neorhizobium galegae]